MKITKVLPMVKLPTTEFRVNSFYDGGGEMFYIQERRIITFLKVFKIRTGWVGEGIMDYKTLNEARFALNKRVLAHMEKQNEATDRFEFYRAKQGVKWEE